MVALKKNQVYSEEEQNNRDLQKTLQGLLPTHFS